MESKNNDLMVYYANELARKYSKFSLEEQKVLHIIFSKIKPYEKNLTTFKLNKLDFFNKLELESKDRYSRYRKLVHGLINKSFFEVIDEQGGQRVGVVIFDSYWKPKEPYFEVSLNPNFMPYLEQLVKDYTKIELSSILKLKSKHSLTLYKFICSWTDDNKKINKRYITTKDLKDLFGLNSNDYVCNEKFRRYDFERETINIAIREINFKTNISIEFKKNKKGNRVLNYEFIWIKKVNSVIKSKSILSKSNLSKN